ncbi:MAG: RidA family protein [Gammaproteobacteria bacterium]
MKRETIHSERAPAAIGSYSQAVAAGGFVFLSGQIGFDPTKGELVAGGLEAEARRVFGNLAAVATAAGGNLGDIVKLTVYLADLGDYAKFNELMREHFEEPYPARAVVEVSALPRGARIEIEAILAR